MKPDEQAIRARLVTANVAANQKWDSWSTQWHKAYGEDVPALVDLLDDLREACMLAAIDLQKVINEYDPHGSMLGDIDNVRLTLWLASKAAKVGGDHAH